jgi:uncharacterized protein YvpB
MRSKPYGEKTMSRLVTIGQKDAAQTFSLPEGFKLAVFDGHAKTVAVINESHISKDNPLGIKDSIDKRASRDEVNEKVKELLIRNGAKLVLA